MIKIKQFREKLCEDKYVRDCGGYHSLEMPDLKDKEINDFMKDKKVIDVKVNTFEADGRCCCRSQRM